MDYICVTYTLKWQLSFAPNYQWPKDGMCFNVKTGRQIKQVYNNGCIGYSIKGKFYSAKHLRKHLVKIQRTKLPF